MDSFRVSNSMIDQFECSVVREQAPGSPLHSYLDRM